MWSLLFSSVWIDRLFFLVGRRFELFLVLVGLGLQNDERFSIIFLVESFLHTLISCGLTHFRFLGVAPATGIDSSLVTFTEAHSVVVSVLLFALDIHDNL